MADANLVHMIQQLKQEWSKMRLYYLDLQKAVDATIMELTQDIVKIEKRLDNLETRKLTPLRKSAKKEL